MFNIKLLFTVFLIYPLTLSAQVNDPIDTELFDELPIKQSEVNSVTQLFWNAQSIQDSVKQSLPSNVRSKFTRGDSRQGCDVKSVSKSEGSADTCQLNDDPEKMGKFIYSFNVSCNFGSYQVSVCSREESKLLNQVKVINPERLVLDDNVLDLDSTM
jgi:hypothetical protein